MTIGVQIQENEILSTNNKFFFENPKEQPNSVITVIFIFKSQTTIYIHPIINQKMQREVGFEIFWRRKLLLKKERLDHKSAPSAKVGSEIFFTSSQARSRVQDTELPTRKSCRTTGADRRFSLLLPPSASALLPPSLFFFLSSSSSF